MRKKVIGVALAVTFALSSLVAFAASSSFDIDAGTPYLSGPIKYFGAGTVNIAAQHHSGGQISAQLMKIVTLWPDQVLCHCNVDSSVTYASSNTNLASDANCYGRMLALEDGDGSCMYWD